jgi:hypothetical protein
MDRKEHDKQYYLKNKERHSIYVKKFKKENKEKVKEYNNKYRRQKYHKDPHHKVIQLIRCRLYEVLGGGRSKHTLEILGCSAEELHSHLQSQFQPWMTWENMGGRYIYGPDTTWDIDHIIPISSAQTEEDIYRLSHYTNLQPLCSHYNRNVKRNIY